MRKIIFPIILIIIAQIFLLSAGFAEQPTVIATLDKDTATVNEELHLIVRVENSKGSIPPPKMPSLQGFDIIYYGRTSQFKFVNGKTQSITEFAYVLTPKAAGQFVIQPIKVVVGGVERESGFVRVTVTEKPGTAVPQQSTLAQNPASQGSSGATSPRPTLPQYPALPAGQQQPSTYQQPPMSQPAAAGSKGTVSDMGNDQIFLRAQTNKMTVYANEQVLLGYSLFTMLDTRYEGFTEEPETSGFWIEEFPMEQEVTQETETVNRKRYVRADIRKMALFATAPGTYTIKPGVIKASVQMQEQSSSMFDEFFNDSFFANGGFFARRVEKQLTAPPIQIMVKPLPEAGKPQSFKGAVGNFRMSTIVEKRVVKQNEALTLTVTIEGEGNIETISPPVVPDIPDAKTYASDTKTQLFRLKDVIGGKKTFEIVVVPGREGEFVIPSLEFSFFNPTSSQYIVLRSDRSQIKVEKSNQPPPVIPREILNAQMDERRKAVKRESEDIQFIKESVRPGSGARMFDWMRGFGIANVLATLFYIAAVLLRKRNEFFEQNVSFKRKLFARKIAVQGIARLEKLEKQSHKDKDAHWKFYEEAAKLLDQYLADKLNLSSHGITRSLVEQALSREKVERAVVDEINHFYDICDRVRFGRIEQADEDPKLMMKALKQMMNVLEKL
ncbi:MAG: hypothetical protein A3G33_06825 [Omnitrophica bacterium RIFCSPLOWO2_12_FULL_44_17]|uniref:Protein BatD n=1 Tax=Candidatus Danuiimicrobium aquiferis TaxID=1801832 RepID=A0A1G1L2L3_9BACT|nr:MAG: hypothetical protein A3B72_03405 [Omnitrophica bacterium RIFCSPHIGHO2_02_FULL_45_28]OGW88370.1 MAG: hypothetical protein A3E74_09075 [Omnitrophica bacterium RIFCSPHIGHO2_12_FULL_44_12]OGW99395.1 MAG: hypothetical protein A3G33_06825 [Omnitrophica bacterium RIFCSPLOWO2_12_FULL_44_17]OGX03420.1 MAG: hypothetical protein A3J12_11610 [Omnitrophica bacterium RIFCSPLOWO2_02_FULL_44_11]